MQSFMNGTLKGTDSLDGLWNNLGDTLVGMFVREFPERLN